MTPGTLSRVFLTVLLRPGLWWVALVALRRLAAPGWWRRWPPLPAPDPHYWRFRLVTAYGSEHDEPPSTDDVVAYLRWCRRMRGARG
ncbi:MAG TPA: hypothetical protein VK277_01200 [Acidimicrobiales bacterium]|nr:hypothetical protein [Acidimicrobiales bacterium]